MYEARIFLIDEQGTRDLFTNRVFHGEDRDQAEDRACKDLNDTDADSKVGEECVFDIVVSARH